MKDKSGGDKNVKELKNVLQIFWYGAQKKNNNKFLRVFHNGMYLVNLLLWEFIKRKFFSKTLSSLSRYQIRPALGSIRRFKSRLKTPAQSSQFMAEAITIMNNYDCR